MGLQTKTTITNRVNAAIRAMKMSPEFYAGDIKLLAIKAKWGLLNPIDVWRVCHIYMATLANSLSYCSLPPDQQANQMLSELVLVVKHLEKKKKRPGTFNI